MLFGMPERRIKVNRLISLILTIKLVAMSDWIKVRSLLYNEILLYDERLVKISLVDLEIICLK